MEQFELPPDHNRENLNEQQKEALTAMGFENIAELKEFLEQAEDNVKEKIEQKREGYADFIEPLSRRTQFRNGLHQIEEMGDASS